MFDSPKLIPGGKCMGYILYHNNIKENNNDVFIIDCNDRGLLNNNTIKKINLSK